MDKKGESFDKRIAAAELLRSFVDSAKHLDDRATSAGEPTGMRSPSLGVIRWAPCGGCLQGAGVSGYEVEVKMHRSESLSEGSNSATASVAQAPRAGQASRENLGSCVASLLRPSQDRTVVDAGPIPGLYLVGLRPGDRASVRVRP